MDTIKGMLGIRSSAEKAARAQAQAAQVAQGRAQEQDAAQTAMNGSAADRIARGMGQRTLAFQGNESGVGGSTTLGG